MGVVKKGDNWRQRKRIATMSMNEIMENKAIQERTPPTRNEVKCKKCGFKARYQFVRCPECNEVQN